MNKDFRVAIGLTTHPKTIKLMRRLGDRAFYNLIRLWSYVAQSKPDGTLCNVDTDDIEIAADWQGKDGVFCQALIDLHFLDEVNGIYTIHGWREHNGYAANAESRSNKARLAAAAKWDKVRKK